MALDKSATRVCFMHLFGSRYDISEASHFLQPPGIRRVHRMRGSNELPDKLS